MPIPLIIGAVAFAVGTGAGFGWTTNRRRRKVTRQADKAARREEERRQAAHLERLAQRQRNHERARAVLRQLANRHGLVVSDRVIASILPDSGAQANWHDALSAQFVGAIDGAVAPRRPNSAERAHLSRLQQVVSDGRQIGCDAPKQSDDSNSDDNRNDA